MKERLRRWLLAKLLGREVYPGRTGNTPELVQVLKVEIHLLCVTGRYRDGSTSSFVYKPEQLLLAKETAAGV